MFWNQYHELHKRKKMCRLGVLMVDWRHDCRERMGIKPKHGHNTYQQRLQKSILDVEQEKQQGLNTQWLMTRQGTPVNNETMSQWKHRTHGWITWLEQGITWQTWNRNMKNKTRKMLTCNWYFLCILYIYIYIYIYLIS